MTSPEILKRLWKIKDVSKTHHFYWCRNFNFNSTEVVQSPKPTKQFCKLRLVGGFKQFQLNFMYDVYHGSSWFSIFPIWMDRGWGRPPILRHRQMYMWHTHIYIYIHTYTLAFVQLYPCNNISTKHPNMMGPSVLIIANPCKSYLHMCMHDKPIIYCHEILENNDLPLIYYRDPRKYPINSHFIPRPWLPSGNQTWLAGKSPMSGGF